MYLFAYFIYKFSTLVVDLDFKAPMPTYHLVQNLSDSRSSFVFGRFRLRPFWKIVNQDDDMTIPIDLWKVKDVYSSLFHHIGWYWYQLQLYLWRLSGHTFSSLNIVCIGVSTLPSKTPPPSFLLSPPPPSNLQTVQAPPF